jgi:hypothetical protein
VVNWWVRLAPAARPASAFLSCACPPVHACVYCTHAVGVQVDFYSGGAGKLRDPEEEPRRADWWRWRPTLAHFVVETG